MKNGNMRKKEEDFFQTKAVIPTAKMNNVQATRKTIKKDEYDYRILEQVTTIMDGGEAKRTVEAGVGNERIKCNVICSENIIVK